ncbi:uncharacterized protein LOC134219143 [Armigeres subalbatus]|uniref:uncharacterized protein LOC134219143 n=1 Tax=Armigeres subalbatus TaxID=124917 RepID=UPI002ED62B90
MGGNTTLAQQNVKALSDELEAGKVLIEQLKLQLKAHEDKEVLGADQHCASEPVSDDGSIEFIPASGSSSTQRAAPTLYGNLEESRFMSSVNQLSVSSISVPECKPGDGDDEIYRHSYETWRELLEDTLRLAGVDDESTKFTIFKIKAGPRLLRIFRNTKSQHDAPDAAIEPFANAMHRLKSYFGSGSDVMLQRRKLAMMKQKPGETSLSFITRVGDTARLCEFGEDKEFEEIVGAIAEHAMCREVRIAALKMLSRKGTFASLVDKVRELEAIKINEEFFKQNNRNPDSTLIAQVSAGYNTNDRGANSRYNPRRGRFQHIASRRRVDRYNPIQRFRYTGGNERNRKTPFDPENGPERCWRCSSVFHQPSECTAVDKTCLGCGNIGHIRRACRNSNISREFKNTTDGKMRLSEAKIEKIAAIEKSDSEVVPLEKAVRMADRADMMILYQIYVDSDDNIVSAKVAGMPCEFLIDSGAQVNTFTEKSFSLLMSDDRYKKDIFNLQSGSDRHLKAYATPDGINVVATFEAYLYLSDERPVLIEKFYVVNETRALLGRATATRYSVLLLGLKVPVVTVPLYEQKNGWEVKDDKVRALENFRRPVNCAEVKSFLGLVTYIDRFILNRAAKTHHLRAVANADKFVWTDDHEREFKFLTNEALKIIKRLGYYNCTDKIELFVDASPIGLGAVLVQFNSEGKPRIIACASKALTSTEQRYPHTQKEALAVVWGVERFSPYLLSKSFIIRTDAEANEYIFNSTHRLGKRATTRAESWALRLQQYDYTIERVPGVRTWRTPYPD